MIISVSLPGRISETRGNVLNELDVDVVVMYPITSCPPLSAPPDNDIEVVRAVELEIADDSVLDIVELEEVGRGTGIVD